MMRKEGRVLNLVIYQSFFDFSDLFLFFPDGEEEGVGDGKEPDHY